MALVDHTWTTFNLSEGADVTFIGSDTVAVGLKSIRGLRQRVADRSVHASITTVAELSLQTIVVGDAEVHDHVYLTHAAVCRGDWARKIRRRHCLSLIGAWPWIACRTTKLSLRSAIERRRCIQID